MPGSLRARVAAIYAAAASDAPMTAGCGPGDGRQRRPSALARPHQNDPVALLTATNNPKSVSPAPPTDRRHNPAIMPIRQDQRCLTTVSNTVESSTAVNECGASGTIIRSPVYPDQDSSPAVRTTRPCKTCTVASPGFSCSASVPPARKAITVWRRICSWPPYTVFALRPLDASRAEWSSVLASAVNDVFCTVSHPLA